MVAKTFSVRTRARASFLRGSSAADDQAALSDTANSAACCAQISLHAISNDGPLPRIDEEGSPSLTAPSTCGVPIPD